MGGALAASFARAVWLSAVLLSAVLWSHGGHAQPKQPPNERGASIGAADRGLGRLLARVGQVDDADAYALLRRIWLAWDTVDPDQVEAALAGAAADPSLSPPLRVYAGMLQAYARRRRGDLVGAMRRFDELGFVRDWLVVGPFDNENRPGLSEQMMPERELDEPVVLDRSFQGKVRSVRWRVAPNAHRFGWLDLGAMLRPNRQVCAFATTFVRSTAAPSKRARQLSLWVGATGAFKVYWNEREVLSDEAYRQLDADRLAVRVALQPGFNRITAKVCAHESAPTVSLRIGEPDGSVARDVEVMANERAGTLAAAAMRAAPTVPEARRGGRPPALLGPVQAFEAQMAALSETPDAADAARMHAYASYLMLTGGDPEASHRARDLARRAAETAPTADHWLLAAKLAGDRNRMRQWVEAAAEHVSNDEQRVQLWLARARLARSGPNWREAVPLYQRVLRIDPHDVEALLGEVDLFVEAGLGRTALSMLQRARERQPRALALLRGLAAQLRALGRDSEAASVEAAYASLRFDDAGYIKQRIELAVARRQRQVTERWIRRLLRAEPSSSWAHGVAARAYRALGNAESARKTHHAMLRIAPEDAASLRALADLHGELGQRAEQVAFLRRLLRVQPQAKAERAYLEHIEPSSARDDEQYAWPAERFLAERAISETKHPRRTLRKLAVTTVLDNGMARRFRQVVFQPLSDEEAARARQFAFSFHADRQVVQLRAAKVYRADGRVDEAIETGQAPLNDPSINMYTLQRMFYVQFPRLEVGDVVELRYRIDDVAVPSEMTGVFADIEPLQGADPIDNAEYVLIAPKDKKLSIRHSALPGLDRSEKLVDGRRITRLLAKNVAPIEVEPHMPPLSEVVAQVHVSSFDSWDAVARWYWGLAHDKLEADEDVRRLARKLVAGLSNERDKVAAIYRHAANETRYVALELGIEGIRPRRAALTLARGWGDCKDKATLIVSMLRELGIASQLVLVRTGLRGHMPTDNASLAPFDHAIVYVPSLDLYLDGTAAATGASELPAFDRDAMALRVSAAGGKLVHIPEPPASASLEQHHFELELAADGSYRFEAKLRNQGFSAAAWRSRYQAGTSQRERIAAAVRGGLGPLASARGRLCDQDYASARPVGGAEAPPHRAARGAPAQGRCGPAAPQGHTHQQPIRQLRRRGSARRSGAHHRVETRVAEAANLTRRVPRLAPLLRAGGRGFRHANRRRQVAFERAAAVRLCAPSDIVCTVAQCRTGFVAPNRRN
jgi:transglutaminase-like putative cysteine protease/tetratricopeptide (TPR) repeat protein